MELIELNYIHLALFISIILNYKVHVGIVWIQAKVINGTLLTVCVAGYMY